jgi:predicted nucleic acid-binding protein
MMNKITPLTEIEDAYMSRADEAKLVEDRLQLEDEAYARKRRIRNRAQRQAKLNALRRLKRRNRVIKLSLFWTGAIALGAFTVIWNADAIVAALSHALRMV